MALYPRYRRYRLPYNSRSARVGDLTAPDATSIGTMLSSAIELLLTISTAQAKHPRNNLASRNPSSKQPHRTGCRISDDRAVEYVARSAPGAPHLAKETREPLVDSLPLRVANSVSWGPRLHTRYGSVPQTPPRNSMHLWSLVLGRIILA